MVEFFVHTARQAEADSGGPDVCASGPPISFGI